jgi:putative component of toxin-antitoxin plasmid stabilization module
MLPLLRTEIRYYVTSGGHTPFADWFEDLNVVARAKVTRAVARLERRNFSNVKPVGEGVLELPSISDRDTGFISGAMAKHW